MRQQLNFLNFLMVKLNANEPQNLIFKKDSICRDVACNVSTPKTEKALFNTKIRTTKAEFRS
jgi:hypothetical protein